MLFWKESQAECAIVCAHILMGSRCAKGMCSVIFERTQAPPIQSYFVENSWRSRCAKECAICIPTAPKRRRSCARKLVVWSTSGGMCLCSAVFSQRRTCVTVTLSLCLIAKKKKKKKKKKNLSDEEQSIKLSTDASFVKTVCRRTIFHDERCWRTFRIWWSCWMSRVHLPSRWWILNTQIVDSWKYRNSPCIGSGDQLPWRKTWNWDQNSFFIRRWISIVGQYFERT